MEEQSFLSHLPEVLTTRETAQVLRCSKAHVCNLLNGKVEGLPALPYLPLGRKRLVRKVVLIEWIKQRECRPQSDRLENSQGFSLSDA